MSCVTCGDPGHDTRGAVLCVRHGGVPSAAFVAALVGGTAPGDGTDRGDRPWDPESGLDLELDGPPGGGSRRGGADPLDDLELGWGLRPETGFGRLMHPAGGALSGGALPGDALPDGAVPGGPRDAGADDDLDDELEDGPPAALRVFTWLFVVVTVLHVVLLVVDVLVLRREDAVLRTYAAKPTTLDLPSTTAVFELVDRVADAVSVALWVTLLMFAVWFGVVGRVADRLGHDRRALLRHWTYLGWRMALVPLVVYLFAEAARDELRPTDRMAFVAEALAVNHTAITFASLRIVMLTLLGSFAVVVWRRLNPPDPVLPPPY